MDSDTKSAFAVRSHKITEEYGLVVGDSHKRTLNPGGVAMWHDPVYDVEEFHKRFAQVYNGSPRQLPLDLQSFRSKFLAEELREYEEEGVIPGNLEKQVDSLIDLIYVAYGTLYLMGVDAREAWRRVQRANMGKELANPQGDARSHRDVKYDIVKPEGWMPPCHDDLVV
jgi:predicted HAD superfamily Cof-like phosphohydrolase